MSHDSEPKKQSGTQQEIDKELIKLGLASPGAKVMSERIIGSLSQNRGVVAAIGGLIGAVWIFQAKSAQFEARLNTIETSGSPALMRHIEEEKKLHQNDHDLLILLHGEVRNLGSQIIELKDELKEQRRIR